MANSEKQAEETIKHAFRFMKLYERHDDSVEGYTPHVYQIYAKLVREMIANGVSSHGISWKVLQSLDVQLVNEALESIILTDYLKKQQCHELNEVMSRVMRPHI